MFVKNSGVYLDTEIFQFFEFLVKEKNGQLFDELDNFEYIYDSVKETETMEILNGDGNTIIKIN